MADQTRESAPVVRKSFDNLLTELPGGRQNVREPVSEAQLLGFWLAVAIFVLIAAVVAGAVVYLALAMPKLADFGTPATEASLALWQTSSTDIFNRATTLVEQIVVKILLPVFTLLLGYIFGTTIRRSSPPSNGDG